jgi:hypothetical protein
MAENNLIPMGWTHKPHLPVIAGSLTGRVKIMAVAALVTWILTAGLGLYMFAIWLIEDDGSEDGRSYRRLRAPVVFGHAGLAVAGLGVWFVSIYVHLNILGWITVLILAVVATLGVFMFTRWIPVHQMASPRPALPARQEIGLGSRRSGADSAAAPEDIPGGPIPGIEPLPAEHNFPLPVVLLHGVLAVTTITLVITAMIL